MKVAICSTHLPPVAGGAEQVAWETAKRLAKIPGVSVHIITFGNKETEFKENMQIHYLPDKPLKSIYYATVGFFKIKKILDLYQCDVVHMHMPLPFGYVLRNVKIPKVITAHGNDIYASSLFERYFIKRAFKKAQRITTVSKAYVDLLKEKWGFDSVLVPNGVDPLVFSPKKGKKEKMILFVGRFVKEKGILEIIEAAKSLKEYQFYFAGNGPLGKKLNGKNIVNLGFKNKGELRDLYAKAGVCVFPSYHESFGIAALEAMACGCPVVVTKLGFSEFVEQNKEGLIIPTKNVDKLKDAIVKIMGDSALQEKMSKNAVQKAAKYNWDDITKQYYGLYLK